MDEFLSPGGGFFYFRLLPPRTGNKKDKNVSVSLAGIFLFDLHKKENQDETEVDLSFRLLAGIFLFRRPRFDQVCQLVTIVSVSGGDFLFPTFSERRKNEL
ncbi:MAG: hypothetical protein R3A44_00585 [Caldilineaceae bacterium]